MSRRIAWRSLRVRLTLWNLAVLTLALVMFGGILVVGNEKRLRSEIDQELTMRALGAMRAPMPPGPPRDRGRDFGEPQTPGSFRQDDGPSGTYPKERPGPPPGEDPSLGSRRVLFIDSTGKVVRPQDITAPIDPEAVVHIRDGRERFTTVSVDGERLRVLTAPWRIGGQVQGAVQVARELGDIEAFQRSILWTFLALLPVAIGAAGVGAAFLTSRALRPVGALGRAAEEIRSADLDRRLPVVGSDEFAELSTTLNRMIERLHASFSETRASKAQVEAALENQRRFSADASHELRTPLTRLKLATSGLLTEPELAPSQRDAVRVADESADSMSKLVQQLLLLSRADAGDLGLVPVPLDLRLVASDAVGALPPELAERISVVLPQEEVPIVGDADHLQRLALNLLENSIRHTPPPSLIRISVEQATRGATLVVADRGTGIPPEDLPRVFERFYRVDKSRSRQDGGCGLGLAISLSIAEAHGGSIAIESTFGQGTTVRVSLPSKPLPQPLA